MGYMTSGDGGWYVLNSQYNQLPGGTTPGNIYWTDPNLTNVQPYTWTTLNGAALGGLPATSSATYTGTFGTFVGEVETIERPDLEIETDPIKRAVAEAIKELTRA